MLDTFGEKKKKKKKNKKEKQKGKTTAHEFIFFQVLDGNRNFFCVLDVMEEVFGERFCRSGLRAPENRHGTKERRAQRREKAHFLTVLIKVVVVVFVGSGSVRNAILGYVDPGSVERRKS